MGGAIQMRVQRSRKNLINMYWLNKRLMILKVRRRGFPHGIVVETSSSNARGPSSISNKGTKILYASRPKETEQKTETILYQIQ